MRGYTVTTGVWGRGILQSVYGLDLGTVISVLSGDEPVAEYAAPSHVVPASNGDLASMLLLGGIDAAIGAGTVDSAGINPLIPDANEASAEYCKRTGVYPINHTLVFKNGLL